MNKQEFLQLFELEDIYSKYQFNIPFSFGLHDYLTGTDTFIFFGFHSINEIKFCIEFSEFSKNRQELEVHFLLDKNIISINQNQVFKNEIFPFLTFDTNLDVTLKFLAGILNPCNTYNLILLI